MKAKSTIAIVLAFGLIVSTANVIYSQNQSQNKVIRLDLAKKQKAQFKKNLLLNKKQRIEKNQEQEHELSMYLVLWSKA